MYDHSRKLYKRDPEVERFHAIRAKVLRLITKKFSMADNRKLKALPIGEEIKRIVLGFPNEKSPDGDDVTYDFLQDCWSFVGDCCKEMVLSFWRDAKLSPNTKNGIVKMTPKRMDQL